MMLCQLNRISVKCYYTKFNTIIVYESLCSYTSLENNMKSTHKIILSTIVLVVIQFVVSYIGYIVIDDHSVLLKVSVIMMLNWLIVIVMIGIFIVFNDYSKSFVSMKNLYAKYQMTIILYDLLKKLAVVEDAKDIYNMILKAAAKAIPRAKYGSVIMNKNGKMVFEASFGLVHEYLELIEMDLAETALYMFTEGEMNRPVIIPDVLSINEGSLDESQIDMFVRAGVKKIKATIAAPIVVGKTIVGSINLDSPVANCFKKSDIEMLDIFALEVSKFVQLHEILELNKNMSRFDELTKIYNRGYCSRVIKEFMEEGKPYILVLADINNLKEVNDLYGHELGDALIVSFVNNIKLFLPDDVIFARYGGDEFVFVFPEHDEVEALVVMDDASKFFANQTIQETGPQVSVSFCYGIVTYPKESRDYDEILKIADSRMYHQKRKYKKTKGND